MQPPEPPPHLKLAADALRNAFPDYQVTLTSGGGRHRLEVVRQRGDGPWCMISSEPRDIWRELLGTAGITL